MAIKGLLARGPPPGPAWIIFLRGAIVLLSVVVLGISAWGVSILVSPFVNFKRDTIDIPGLGPVDLGPVYDEDFDSLGDFDDFTSSSSGFGYGLGSGFHGSSAFALGVFSALFVLGSTVVITALERFLPRFVWRFGPLCAYVLSIIFLLCTWAIAASNAASLQKADGAGGYYKKLYSADATLAGLGALLWLLVIVNTVFFVLGCLKHPDSHAPGVEQPTQMQATPNKVEAGYGVQPQYGAQPQYGQQMPAGQMPSAGHHPVQ